MDGIPDGTWGQHMIEWIAPDELRNHPTNLSIYGDTPDQELVDSVSQYGVFPDHPIGYVFDGEFRVIVSGHRRRQAALLSKQEHVPIVHLKEIEGDDLAIKERIILSNKHRVKTREQLAREAAQLAEIEEERTKVQKINNLKNQQGIVDAANLAASSGRASEKIAETLNVSVRTAERLVSAGKRLAAAETNGDTATATQIKNGLKRSVEAGEKAAKAPKPPKNGAPVQQIFDDKGKFDKQIGIIRRALDERLKLFPGSERFFNKARYALGQLQDILIEWRENGKQ